MFQINVKGKVRIIDSVRDQVRDITYPSHLILKVVVWHNKQQTGMLVGVEIPPWMSGRAAFLIKEDGWLGVHGHHARLGQHPENGNPMLVVTADDLF